jgi:hypothetical protein
VNKFLADLHLGYNQFGPEGGKYLANALEVIFYLDVNPSHFDVICFQVNTSVTSLDLNFNELDTEAGKALGRALEVCFTLGTQLQRAN